MKKLLNKILCFFGIHHYDDSECIHCKKDIWEDLYYDEEDSDYEDDDEYDEI